MPKTTNSRCSDSTTASSRAPRSLPSARRGHLEAGREYGEWIAGPNGAAPAASATVVTHLEPGRYIVGCLIPSPDGTPHTMKGMLSELTVTPATSAAAPNTDDALPVVNLAEYHVELPDDFGTGAVTVRNAGEEVHELVIAQLAGGATVQEVIAYESAPRPHPQPQPYTLVTGTSFIDPVAKAVSTSTSKPENTWRSASYLPLRARGISPSAWCIRSRLPDAAPSVGTNLVTEEA